MPTTLVLTFARSDSRAGWQEAGGDMVGLPPSPWWLLRVLCAVWRTRAPQLPPGEVLALLARLAEPPVFFVPSRMVAPGWGDPGGRRAHGGRVVVVERGGELGVRWTFELPAAQRAVFDRIASSIPYLGRVQWLCSGQLRDDWLPGEHEVWCPADAAERLDPQSPGTAVLAATLPLDTAALQADPVQAGRDGLPGGARLIGYLRSRTPARRAEAVRFAVAQSELPSETVSLAYTDLLRQAALSRLGRLPRERPRTHLGGRDCDAAGGSYQQDQHQHAHYLPLSRHGRLAGIVVWTPDGLPEDELRALTQVNHLQSAQDHAWQLNVRVTDIGPAAAVAPELCGPSLTWRSLTPFTPARYPKRNADWHTFLTAEIGRELRYRAQPEPLSVDLMNGTPAPWLRYRPSAQLRRDPHQGNTTRPSAFLRLQFDSTILGPLAIGHLSHFGLGLFSPDGTPSPDSS